MNFTTQDSAALDKIERQASERYEALRRRNLQLDMTRGKPAPEQLDLSDGILGVVGSGDCIGPDGADYRNYGILTGIPEAKAFFAAYMEVEPDDIIVGGNSSLTMMYDAIAGAVLFGVPGGRGPWRDQESVKFLCPVPGYDRHFAVCERLGLEMVTIEMKDGGPEMDAVEALVAEDEGIMGIWCVPKYSNPTGIVYSDAVVDRLASMKTAAPDFRIIWDNAYAYHHLGSGPASVKHILKACNEAGTPDRPLLFGSTSKITHAGGGVAMLAASPANIADATKKLFYASIGPDKINQLRHVRFFGDLDGLIAHMDRLAAIMAPKFAAVDGALERHLAGKDIATWTKPEGGYFVSVDLVDGCAAEVVRLAGDVGVKLTPAGATYPLGHNPRDHNLRLAPTMPSVGEVEQAMEVFCNCVELASARKLREMVG
jgi:aspartate/methionine/tyrosine aminotransferase